MKGISAELRRDVLQRARHRCEYCLMRSGAMTSPHEIDHIYAEKHGGKTEASNLALACFDCNRFKGSDLASIDPFTSAIVPLYHPRNDIWIEHFDFAESGRIESLTPTGRVTAKLLRFNDELFVADRRDLLRQRRY